MAIILKVGRTLVVSGLEVFQATQTKNVLQVIEDQSSQGDIMTSIIAEGHGLHREAGPARPGGGEVAVAHAHLLPGGDGGGDRRGGQAGAAALHRKSSLLHGDIEIEEMHQHYIKCLRVSSTKIP